ncbi:hypothetical protein LSH36_272g02036 [Paralvinella palmiformis]|uniref:E3 UFM1-protein ligase 1 homolog n=1 Tax=Paralvinella palmiformis TaxID=53620 RepID=A0AAD9JJR6_9ANNE|nr:hypothetical protein LSH36_272g02036 [Paralvinella palmiformis]
MADWEEIKRLAADFQRAQLSSTIQRLSERNCIEIVQKLVQLKLIDVIYTLDGKEYLTHEELGKEILEELQARGGRVNIVELQTALNVDLSHIESKVNTIVGAEKNLTLVLGQLIDRAYLNRLAEEINDRLQEQGRVMLVELTKLYDLPADLILQTIHHHLGTVIKGQIDDFDRDLLYTETYVNRHRSIIKGAFSAITRPTSLGTVMSKYDLYKSLFYRVLDQLVCQGDLAGTVSGGHQERAQYVPDIYTRSQNEWVDSFFRQNGYLEYDSLSRLGIADAKSYIKKRFKANSLQYLSSCCIGCLLQERIEAEIDEELASTGWFDIMPSLPSICTETDANQMLMTILRHKSHVIVISDTIVANDSLLSACRRPFDDIIQTKAEMIARTNPGLLSANSDKKGRTDDSGDTKEDKREERRKKAFAGKSGGGVQGREVKTKSTKKKGFRGRDSGESDEATKGHQSEQEVFTVEEIIETLRNLESLEDCPDELILGVAERLHRPLNKEFIETAKSVFLQSTGGSTRRKTLAELSEKINSLWVNVKLFEKGIKHFNDDTQVVLTKHLLKTICTDITNMVFSNVAADHMVSLDCHYSGYTAESRNKISARLSDNNVKAILSKLNGSLNGKSIEDFMTQLDEACGPDMLDINLRKADKKKERQITFHHRQDLMEQLKQELDPALSLHLAAVILFQVFTQTMLHAPGRCVPQIISALKPNLTPEDYKLLIQYQDLVLKQLRYQDDNKSEELPDGADIKRQLEELLPKVKDVALTAKKGAVAQVTED